MEDGTSGLLTVLGLVALHALMTLASAANANTRTAWLKEQAEDGSRRARLALQLNASSGAMFTTFQVLTLILRFAIAAVTVLNIANPILNANPELNSTIIYTLTLIVSGLMTLILGEIVPEAVGSTYATALTLWFVNPTRWLMTLLSPVVVVVLAISKLISSVLGSSGLVNTVTEEEIMTLVDAGHTGGTIEEEEKDMIYSVLQLDQTRVSEVMVPRIDVMGIDIEKTPEEAGKIFVSTGFSRIPVYEDNIDNIKGLLYAKDVLAYWTDDDDSTKTIKDLMRQAYFVPETKPADELLKELQAKKVHLAIVVDEYGGTAGLVTIENIIEEIIGDIQDEYDLHEEAEYVQMGPDEYTVDASIDLDDFNDLLDVDLPTEDNDTLGGHIYTHFGRVPLVNEVIELDDLFMRVLSVDGRRIRKVHVIRKHSDEDSGSADEIAAPGPEAKDTKEAPESQETAGQAG